MRRIVVERFFQRASSYDRVLDSISLPDRRFRCDRRVELAKYGQTVAVFRS
jgi:hypothetical protein